jgi:hypothetical protein
MRISGTSVNKKKACFFLIDFMNIFHKVQMEDNATIEIAETQFGLKIGNPNQNSFGGGVR